MDVANLSGKSLVPTCPKLGRLMQRHQRGGTSGLPSGDGSSVPIPLAWDDIDDVYICRFPQMGVPLNHQF